MNFRYIAAALGGAAVGSAVTYLVVRKRIERQFADILLGEIEATKAFYERQADERVSQFLSNSYSGEDTEVTVATPEQQGAVTVEDFLFIDDEEFNAEGANGLTLILDFDNEELRPALNSPRYKLRWKKISEGYFNIQEIIRVMTEDDVSVIHIRNVRDGAVYEICKADKD